ncbi:MAG: LysM peptidoglycan-binding domain-containing protein [Deltaproteobacteria bacterium]|nr:LysM peptidoglycan-binding domain-containing protein [Deltaproteobacteria bacterium]
MRRIVLGSLLFPIVANAQVPTTGDAPTTLNPGLSGNQGPPPPPPAPTPAPQRQAQPPVIVVGPDGKVTQTQADEPQRGYYVNNSGNGGDPYQEPTVIHSGAVPELHVVRSGDTLWDICWYYFNDPWQWPKIWSYNAQITNPHWIYPGDLVRLLPRGAFTNGNPIPSEPDGGGNRDPLLPSPHRKIESSVTSTGFVAKSDLVQSITIEGAVDDTDDSIRRCGAGNRGSRGPESCGSGLPLVNAPRGSRRTRSPG